MKNHILLCSVVFKGCEKYLQPFLTSVKTQVNQNFDFLIINDGLLLDDWSLFPSNTIFLSAVGTPAQNRMQTIEYALTLGYDIIIWQDCDDICDSARVSTICEKLGNYDILVHDLSIINESNELLKETFIGSRIHNGKVLQCKDILFYNFIGFGNTAIKTDILKKGVSIPSDIVAVDWYLATVLLYSGASAIYISDVLAKYRQYQNNTASIVSFSNEIMIKHASCVYLHYKHLLQSCPELFVEYPKLTQYCDMISEFQKTQHVLSGSGHSIPPNTLWWENFYRKLWRNGNGSPNFKQ